MPPLKQVTIARGTPGEDSFRSTIRRHHQRIARHRRHNGGEAPNAPTTTQSATSHAHRDEKLPLLLRSHSLPTVVVGKEARKRTVSRADGTKTLAARIRTLGGSSVPHAATASTSTTTATPYATARVAGGGGNQKASGGGNQKASVDAAVHNRPPSVQPATYTETTAAAPAATVNRNPSTAPRKRRRGHHRSRRRVIRITMPSKKRQQQRVKGGAKVHKALRTLDKQGLREVLAKNKLVKADTKAPEALLRHIAAGAF